jgi:hypothetical protein
MSEKGGAFTGRKRTKGLGWVDGDWLKRKFGRELLPLIESSDVSSNTPKQFSQRDPECQRNFLNVYEREISFPSLNTANVGTVHAAHVRKFFLGHTEL